MLSVLHYSHSQGINEAIGLFLVKMNSLSIKHQEKSISKPKILLTTWKSMKETFFEKIQNVYLTCLRF